LTIILSIIFFKARKNGSAPSSGPMSGSTLSNFFAKLSYKFTPKKK